MSDPFSGRYQPKQDESGDSKSPHSCFGKINAIRERIGLILTHDEISYICTYLWHCSDPGEFYRKMDSMSDDELRDWCEKAKLKKPKLLEYESMLYA